MEVVEEYEHLSVNLFKKECIFTSVFCVLTSSTVCNLHLRIVAPVLPILSSPLVHPSVHHHGLFFSHSPLLLSSNEWLSTAANSPVSASSFLRRIKWGFMEAVSH